MFSVVRRRPWLAALARPLPPIAAAGITAGVILTGAVYCAGHAQLGAPPVAWTTSLLWATVALGPWAVAFEALKRGPSATLLTAAALVASAGLSTLVFDSAFFVALYRRLPIAAGFVALAAVAASQRALGPTVEMPSTGRRSPGDEVPFATDDVDFIRASGNYVEVYGPNRSEMHRQTMRTLQATLDPTVFRRIHRSIIVNLRCIAHVHRTPDGRPVRVTLRDGRTFTVGARYQDQL